MKKIEFKDVKVGTWFYYETYFFIKLEKDITENHIRYNCMHEDGSLWYLRDDTYVEPYIV